MKFSDCHPDLIVRLRQVDSYDIWTGKCGYTWINVKILGRRLKTESVDVVPVSWTHWGWQENGERLIVTPEDLSL